MKTFVVNKTSNKRVSFRTNGGDSRDLETVICCLPDDVDAMAIFDIGAAATFRGISVPAKDEAYVKSELLKKGFVEEIEEGENMKRINTEIIKSLKPCENRYKVWLENYAKFDGSLVDFLELDKITSQDKIWVAVRVMPKFLVEVFAIDCAFSAANAADDYAAASAGSAAASTSDDYAAASAASAAASAAANSAADAASYYVDDYVDDYAAASAASAAERENQIDALIMLIKSEAE